MFEPRRRRGELGREPAGKGRKIAGFEYSLDFLVLFHQGKRTVQHDDKVLKPPLESNLSYYLQKLPFLSK
ncbi:MAG TPA: hypothetical protein DCF33_00015 [Saprospirales bacterium]|nr:hypothetical protein [Saprospirales bacterium]